MGWFDDNPFQYPEYGPNGSRGQYQDAQGNPIQVGGGLGTSAGLPPGAQNLGRIGTQPVGGNLGFLAGDQDPLAGQPWPGSGAPQPGGGQNMPPGIAPWLAQIYQEQGITPGERGSGAADWQYWQNEAFNNASGDTGYIRGRIQQAAQGGGGGQNGLNGPVGASPFNFQYDPNSPDAAFLRSEGLRAATQGAAARGILNTGGTLKALQDRAAGLAATDLGNQFQRQLATHQVNFQEPLAANAQAFGQNYQLAGLGLNALNSGIAGANGLASNATSYGNQAQNAANNIGNLYGNIGNAQGNAIIGGQNAYNNLYGDLGNLARRAYSAY